MAEVYQCIFQKQAPLKFFVYIYGLGGTSFLVSIKRSQNVDDLKEAIKKRRQNKLNHVDSDELTLYKVSLPDDENLAKGAEDALANPDVHEKLNPPSCVISRMFPRKPPNDKVSIIVTLPGKG